MAGQLTIDTLKASSGVLATQNGMTGIAKAWVNFDGYTSSTATVRSSFNVSSVTRNSTGLYTINMTTAMPNATYAVSLTAAMYATNNFSMTTCIYGDRTTGASGKTSSAVQVAMGQPAGATFYDNADVNVAIFA